MEGRGNGGGKDKVEGKQKKGSSDTFSAYRVSRGFFKAVFLTSKVKCNPFGDSFLHAVILQDIHTHMRK